ncbi:MAG: response regulator [Dongiaceae bacterium]
MPRILVIDDDEMVRSTVKAMLESRGHEVAVAGDGDDGLRQLRKRPFDLVLCDIFMPNKDGIGTLREVRRTNADVPIVIMTGGSPSAGRLGERADVDYLHMARLLGATRTIGKPFTINQLTTLVEQALTAGRPQPPSGSAS